MADPVISESILHRTEQRLYISSIFVLIQAYKLYTFLFVSSSLSSLPKLLLLDAAFILAVPLLRVPRLTYDRKTRWILVFVIGTLDWLVFGGWRSIPFGSLIPTALTSALTYYPTLSSTRARLRDVIKPNDHLLGAFTLHILPYSTARIPVVPSTQPLSCLSSQIPLVKVPLTFNTTQPHIIEYSLTLPASGTVVFINVTASDLEEVKVARRHLHHPHLVDEDDDEEDEEEEVEHLLALADQKKQLQSIQKQAPALSSIVGQSNLLTLLLPISQPSTVRLSRVWSASGAEFRIARGGEMRIWECPEASFVYPSTVSGKRDVDEKCVGETGILDVVVKGSGGGLKVKWQATDEAGKVVEDGWLEGIGDEDAAVFRGGANEESNLPLVKTDSTPSSIALPQSHLASLPLTFSKKGRKTYTLTGLSSPHTPLLALPSIVGSTSFTYSVYSSPSLSFASTCSSSKPLLLLHPKHAPEKYIRPTINILSSETPEKGRPLSAKIKFEPVVGGGSAWTKDVEVVGRSKALAIESEGTYTLLGVQGGRCAGEVREPSECRVELVPIPEVAMEVRKLQDDCAGELGFVASLTLRGTPPFRLSYQVQRQGVAGAQPQFRTKTISSLQEELTLQEEVEGTYLYEWKSLADQNYPLGIDLDEERRIEDVVQVVHPLAAAELVLGRGTGKKVIWACKGSEVTVEVDLKGKAPFSLTVVTTSPKSRDVVTLTDLPQAKQRIQVRVPEERLLNGGNFTISLGEVKDANGCLRRLTGAAMEVEVRTTKPSARIYSKEGRRSAVVAKGTKVSIPLRLTGEKPWKVEYTNSNLPDKVLSISLGSVNSEMIVDQAGTYRILTVEDAHCRGSIVPDEDSFSVEHLPEPSLALSPDAGVRSSKDGSVIRPGVCVGVDDQFSLKMQGQAPFKIPYSHSQTVKGQRTQGKTLVLGAVQSTKTFPLETSDPGHHTYTFDRIGDTNYAPISHGLLSPARSGKIVVEQEVYSRPSAAFLSPSPISLCSNAVLGPKTSGAKGIVVLTGKAPFDLELNVRTVTSPSPVVKWIRGIKTNEWKLSIPDFEFEFVGTYQVSIASVRDSTGCDEEVLGEEGRSVLVEVAETASVVPVSKSTDVCVGSRLEFLLQGSAPWTLTYDWNGKVTTSTEKASKWSRLSDRPGRFAIKSIAHAKNHCKVEVENVHRVVHALPRASISAGKDFIETVEEGDQAEITFTFEGEAPFSFSYTRSEEGGKGREGKVVETHTVTNIQENHYSIFASTEGTWRVTMIEDRWCRYPPLAGAGPSSSEPLKMLEGIDLFPPLTGS